MKTAPLIVAGLMTFVSVTAFAEGGAERMRYYYESWRLSQQQNQSQKSTELQVPDDQTAQVTENYKP
ncbi:hypothetical protein [Pseudomonas sp. PB3P13]